ncbi:MAG: hypothetical protein FJ319_02675 [SAR202 cluster bacterium]|nr:hypothetical protein [SAR202 cluster bacterium]
MARQSVRTSLIFAAALSGAALALMVSAASAHGFGDRYDLPIPLNYFMVGAAAAVAASFVVIGLFVNATPGKFNYPRYNLLRAPVIGALISSTVTLNIVRIIAVGLFALTLATALFGSGRPLDNFAPTWVWIIWWVGMGYVSALVGNLWWLVNPWKIVYEWVSVLLDPDGESDEGLFDYPEWLDVWPAFALFFAFAWLENVYTSSALPFKLGVLILAYSAITWGGMVAFGKRRWLTHGEAFTVLFGYFARFAPTEVRNTDPRYCGKCSQECNIDHEGCVDCFECFDRARASDRQLNLRPYAVGLVHYKSVTAGAAAFVLLALATVTYDGLSETGIWLDFQNLVYPAFSWLGSSSRPAINTFGLIAIPLLFAALYVLFSQAMKAASGDSAPVSEFVRIFVFSLIPIALAYNMAHFFSLLLFEGQAVIPLASDPFGQGWNLFGTADYRIKRGFLTAKIVWFVSIGAIVLGHILSVFIAHVISLKRFASRQSAMKSQYPMLALIVLYTAASLWILAQPIVQ